MTSQALTLPFNAFKAWAKMVWTGCTNQLCYRESEQDIVVIPYRNEPYFSLRARLMFLSRRTRWLLALGLVFIANLLVVALFYDKFVVLGNHWTMASIVTFLLGAFAVTAAVLVLYLCFGVRDFIVTDQFNMTIPMAINIKRKKNGHANGVRKYHYLIFWSDLEELTIIERPSKNRSCRFYLKLARKSGYDCEIPIRDIPKESIEVLSRQIEKHAPFCRNLSQLAEVSRFQDFEQGLLPGITDDQLWQSLTTKSIDATSFAPLKPNSKLQNDRLTIIRQIASGGFSAVYLAEESDGTKFVLKEFVLPFCADQKLAKKASEHFAREAHFLKTLRHEQIAKVYDHFVEADRNYLLMEYIRGCTLRQLVFDQGPLAEEKILAIAIQLVQILEYLHNQEVPIIHRDLTPDNIILNEYSKLFLVDFGSANEFLGAATGTLVGKHAYMSPEQIRGKATPASDLYSFGQTIFFCYSGREPTPLMSSRPIQRESKLSQRLRQVIEKCTELEARQRFTLPEVIEVLRHSGEKERQQNA